MLSHDRKQFILDLLNKNKSVAVTQLSEMLNTTEVTIRRDLKDLEKVRALKRTHGGAIRNISTAFEPQITELEQENVDKKKAIAYEAYQLLKDNDAIIIDSSSTGGQLAHLIKNGKKRNITVVTNSFKTMWTLMHSDNVEIIHIGGQVRSNIYCSIGPIAEAALQNLRVDKAFIGVNGIDFENGFTTPNLFESQIKRAMMHAAYQVYILADSSKFDQTYLSIICPISRADCLITDSDITEKSISQAREARLDLIIADLKSHQNMD
jgi:DeoR family transcriptional regulator, fructose operon transcriptional repressor